MERCIIRRILASKTEEEIFELRSRATEFGNVLFFVFFFYRRLAFGFFLMFPNSVVILFFFNCQHFSRDKNQRTLLHHKIINAHWFLSSVFFFLNQNTMTKPMVFF